MYKNVKCARSQDANERKKNCKKYLYDLIVHTHSRNIPTVGVSFF